MVTEADVFDTLKYRVVVDRYGTRRYYNSANQLHRDEGPAIEWIDGGKEWFQNGQTHRIGGPAIEWSDGTVSWCLFGKEYTESKYQEQLKDLGVPK